MQIRGTWSAGPGDDQARFLADLRALRDSAAIGYDELAARAHYPSDILKEAENGPCLPGLPILTAYVRACEGNVLDWEERWRRLNPDVPEDLDLPVRPAGASAAAIAGARASTGVAPPDVYDPERIKAALRGGHARSDQGSRKDDPGTSAPAARAADAGDRVADAPGGTAWQAGSAWDAAAGGSGARSAWDAGSGSAWDAGSGAAWDGRSGSAWDGGSGSAWDARGGSARPAANGNHAAAQESRGPFDAAVKGTPDTAGPAETAQPGEFSWLQEPRQAEPEPAPPEADITERMTRHQAGPPTARERTDFWATSAPSADFPPPPAARTAEEPAISRASWSAPAETGTSDGTGSGTVSGAGSTVAPRAGSVAASGAGSVAASGTASATAAQPAGSGARARPDGTRRDRLFPARLLMVIVIAALIGSTLVLLLR